MTEPPLISGTCEWSQNDEDASWETSCGGLFVFNNGGPIDNRFGFCPYCSRPLMEVRTDGEEDEDDDDLDT